MCCSPWGCKESDMTERLNGTELTVCFFEKQDLNNTIIRPEKMVIKSNLGTSLAVQWLRLGEGVGLIPGQGTEITHCLACKQSPVHIPIFPQFPERAPSLLLPHASPWGQPLLTTSADTVSELPATMDEGSANLESLLLPLWCIST